MKFARIFLILVLSGLAPEGARIELAGDQPVIEARIASGAETVRLLLDTGAGITVLDQQLAGPLSLRFLQKANVSGGTDARTEAEIHLSPVLEIGNTSAVNVPVLTMDLRSRGGPFQNDIDGVFSPAPFAPRLAVIDFPAARLSFTSAEGGPSGTAVPYRGNLPQAEVLIAEQAVMAVIDTGAPDILLLPLSMAGNLPLASEPEEAGKARTVNDENTVYKAPLRGDLVIAGRRYSSPDLYFVEGQEFPIIGMAALRDMTVILDPANRQSWLSAR